MSELPGPNHETTFTIAGGPVSPFFLFQKFGKLTKEKLIPLNVMAENNLTKELEERVRHLVDCL